MSNSVPFFITMNEKVKYYLKLYRKIRKTFTINPNTKVKSSKKIYNRSKTKVNFLKEINE